jgi:hypothetical protein
MADECHLTPVIHVLQHPGCVPKPIPSFACTGICTSYVQVHILIKKITLKTIFFGFLLMTKYNIFTWCIAGVWQQDMADREELHVLSGTHVLTL